MGATLQVMDAFGALAPLFQLKDPQLQLAANPRHPKVRRRKGPEATAGDQADQDMPAVTELPVMKVLTTLAQLAIRHDQELQNLRRMDQFMLFLNHEPKGALHILLEETALWKKQLEGPSKSTMTSLRQHLVLSLLKQLRQRADQILASKDTEALYTTSVQKGVILADRSFPNHRWDSVAQKLTLDKKQPISAQKMCQHLEELSEMMLDPELVVRFHALQSPHDSQKIIPWRLQLHLRSDRPYELMFQLAFNSIWMVLGASMKPHTQQVTPLASTLQTMVGKPKGKGKGKSKASK